MSKISNYTLEKAVESERFYTENYIDSYWGNDGEQHTLTIIVRNGVDTARFASAASLVFEARGEITSAFKGIVTTQDNSITSVFGYHADIAGITKGDGAGKEALEVLDQFKIFWDGSHQTGLYADGCPLEFNLPEGTGLVNAAPLIQAYINAVNIYDRDMVIILKDGAGGNEKITVRAKERR